MRAIIQDRYGDRITVGRVPPSAREPSEGVAEDHALAASRVGWVDAHILAACATTGARLWTLDRSLRLAALRIRKPGILDIR